MILTEPVAAALDALRRDGSTAILLDPIGEVFRQARAADLAARTHLIFICPRWASTSGSAGWLIVDRRLRPGRWRVAGSRRHRCGHPPASRRHRGVVHGRGVVRRRAARVPAVHPARGFRGEGVPDILTSGDHGAVAGDARKTRHCRAAPRPRSGEPPSARPCYTPRPAPARVASERNTAAPAAQMSQEQPLYRCSTRSSRTSFEPTSGSSRPATP